MPPSAVLSMHTVRDVTGICSVQHYPTNRSGAILYAGILRDPRIPLSTALQPEHVVVHTPTHPFPATSLFSRTRALNEHRTNSRGAIRCYCTQPQQLLNLNALWYMHYPPPIFFCRNAGAERAQIRGNGSHSRGLRRAGRHARGLPGRLRPGAPPGGAAGGEGGRPRVVPGATGHPSPVDYGPAVEKGGVGGGRPATVRAPGDPGSGLAAGKGRAGTIGVISGRQGGGQQQQQQQAPAAATSIGEGAAFLVCVFDCQHRARRGGQVGGVTPGVSARGGVCGAGEPVVEEEERRRACEWRMDCCILPA